ncbi:secreted RxLR effector protein 161-like [Arachis hypogaea]|uniref:secreted RxLR effector protein 161-like n=1 Tax=Arachis hypogaea TaxID=3818 RepID=UPI003B219ED8
MEHSKSVPTPIKEKFKLPREDKGRLVNPTSYKSLIGSLRYLIATRPDIVFGVSLLSRFMEEPCTNHLQAATDSSIYQSESCGYTDSDLAEDIETRKCTLGFAFHLGFGAISWSSKKQPVVALSTVKA